MEETDINELLTSYNQEFSNKELLKLELHFANEEDDSDRLIEISKEQNLTFKQISKAIGRSLKVSQAVATNINCYKEIYLTLSCSTNNGPIFCERKPTYDNSHYGLIKQ
ncbi:CENPBD1 [Cordylochernes scorpioides]|uniref:CENPBD1 n=1 Tax=Cordylochernes scorpioides TaxID=51811 RepID=A0ABY6JX66_9ARAC|nr:CENPBD1 [Cordylochernes scorpioides]